MIKKRSTVWYYDRVLKEWRKGTVITVNKYFLTIKKRHNAYKGFARYTGTCTPASEPKPEKHPDLILYEQRINSLYKNYWVKYYKEHPLSFNT